MKAAKILPWTGRNRSWKRESWWLASTTGAGTVIGALIGGKKGASLGAASGGVAGWIWRIANR